MLWECECRPKGGPPRPKCDLQARLGWSAEGTEKQADEVMKWIQKMVREVLDQRYKKEKEGKERIKESKEKRYWEGIRTTGEEREWERQEETERDQEEDWSEDEDEEGDEEKEEEEEEGGSESEGEGAPPSL